MSAVGIEINKEFCVLQKKMIEDNGMDHRITVCSQYCISFSILPPQFFFPEV